MGRPALRLFVAVALMAATACFDKPAGAVRFACDPDHAPACPDSYSCAEDGCCHREGSDIDAHWGACGLGTPGSSSGTDPSTTSSSDSTDTQQAGPNATSEGPADASNTTTTQRHVWPSADHAVRGWAAIARFNPIPASVR
ncbi:MAG: hypothetical protein V3V08_09640 [Nannocystaceae bacterium]